MRAALYTLAISIILSSAHAAYADSARIITRENAVREDCRFFAPVKKKVRLNEMVDIVSKDGDWLRVKYKGVAGCIHKSAVDEKNVDISGVSGSKSHAASRDEVALAGKGFNPEVEKTYKGKHPELDFKSIDNMEGSSPSDESIKKFVSNGGLNQP
jgi:hypothetical protein